MRRRCGKKVGEEGGEREKSRSGQKRHGGRTSPAEREEFFHARTREETKEVER